MRAEPRLPIGGGKTLPAITIPCLTALSDGFKFFGSSHSIISLNRLTAALQNMLQDASQDLT